MSILRVLHWCDRVSRLLLVEAVCANGVVRLEL